MPVLNKELNRYIKYFGGLVPHAYSSGHYASFEAMMADYKATGRIKVNVDNATDTAFGDPVTCWLFRAWHDMCHVITGAGFSDSGEDKVCAEMQRQLHAHPDFKNLPIWDRDSIMRILYTECKWGSHHHKSCVEQQCNFTLIYSEGLKVWPVHCYMPI